MILAILQARISSSRLPGKVLKSILTKPMIIHEIERIQNSRTIDQLILATSTDQSDDLLAEVCLEHGVEVYRGSLGDVLDRFYQSAIKYQPDHIVRLTGDCPVIDWTIIDNVIDLHLKEQNDYTSNTLQPTYPDGLDVEVCAFKTLQSAWQNTVLPSEREHVTLYIHQHPEQFRLGGLTNASDLSALRWTVDEPEDFVFVTKIYEELYARNNKFTMDDILKLLAKKPNLQMINNQFARNDGMIKSLAADKFFLKEEGKNDGGNIG